MRFRFKEGGYMPKVFINALLKKEKILTELGYTESTHRHPDLFFKIIDNDVTAYVDFRYIKKPNEWIEPEYIEEWLQPLFRIYDKGRNIPRWKAIRVIQKEFLSLHSRNFYCILDRREYNKWNIEIESNYDFENIGIIEEDGFCKFCRKDFQDEGRFCSKKCKEDYEERLRQEDEAQKVTCIACKKKIDWGEMIDHHVTYFPETKVWVHISCHQKIHKTEDYPELKPPEGDAKRFYAPKKKENP